MFETFEQACAYVAQQGVKMVDLKFCDLRGRWHHLTLARQSVPHHAAKVSVFGRLCRGLKSVKAGDMVLVPDLSIGAIDLLLG